LALAAEVERTRGELQTARGVRQALREQIDRARELERSYEQREPRGPTYRRRS